MPAPNLGWWSGTTRAKYARWPTFKASGLVLWQARLPFAESDHKVARFKTREELLGGFASANLDAAICGRRLCRLVFA